MMSEAVCKEGQLWGRSIILVNYINIKRAKESEQTWCEGKAAPALFTNCESDDGAFYITHTKYSAEETWICWRNIKQEVFPEEGIRNQIGNCHKSKAHNICKTEREKRPFRIFWRIKEIKSLTLYNWNKCFPIRWHTHLQDKTIFNYVMSPPIQIRLRKNVFFPGNPWIRKAGWR